MNQSSAIPFDQLQRFVASALATTGMPDEQASIVADTLVTTDAMGVNTHGTKLLIGYIKKLQAGGYDPRAIPTVERQGPAWGIVDGKSALGMIGCTAAMKLAVDKAKQTGIAYVGLKHTAHVGAIGYYASMGACQGCITMITGNDIPSVAAPGSSRAVLGSNPIAYGIPRIDRDPIFLDMATAATAGGKVYAACQRGEPIPDTWLIGPDGKPTTDGSLYPAQASLAPMAGHKGYGIGLWCEILSAVLPGGNHTWNVGSWLFDDPAKPSNHTASFMAIDVAVITDPRRFDVQLQSLIDEIHAAPKAQGSSGVLLPGEREWSRFHQSKSSGILLPTDVLDKLKLVSQATGTQAGWLP
jgi:LDH2 family malate/lactate/ureidoglycolate dehydrogenase